MKDIQAVRDEAIKVFKGLKDGTIELKVAKEMTNAIGKVINTIKVQLEYSALRDEKPEIEFMSAEAPK